MLLEGTRPSRLWIGTTCIERRSCAASLGERGSAQRIGPIKRHNRRATVTSPELTWKIECGRFWSMRNRLDKIECCAVLGRNRLTGRLQIPVLLSTSALIAAQEPERRRFLTSSHTLIWILCLVAAEVMTEDKRYCAHAHYPLADVAATDDERGPVVIPRRGPKRTHR
jgi:hypothetical protein